ncbi:MAG: hypothetical protein BroJett030_18450 [Alphaproteobacteria bacterium]|nr:MAG: hypothetical protein BroJett030_18450 [Alphaproteobacteria bacterium]
MVAADRFAALALALDGTREAPHFDRRAFRVKRIYATLAADGATANLKLLPDEQAFRCTMNPAAFSPVANAWGRQGWTTIALDRIDAAELADALAAAWRHALPAGS